MYIIYIYIYTYIYIYRRIYIYIYGLFASCLPGLFAPDVLATDAQSPRSSAMACGHPSKNLGKYVKSMDENEIYENIGV